MCEFRLKEICVQVKYFKTFADKVNLVSKHVSTFLGFVSESNNFDLKNIWWDRKTCVWALRIGNPNWYVGSAVKCTVCVQAYIYLYIYLLYMYVVQSLCRNVLVAIPCTSLPIALMTNKRYTGVPSQSNHPGIKIYKFAVQSNILW